MTDALVYTLYVMCAVYEAIPYTCTYISQRAIRNLKQFCQLADEDRRSLVKHLEDQEYKNIINTLRSIPAVTMQCDMKGKAFRSQLMRNFHSLFWPNFSSSLQ